MKAAAFFGRKDIRVVDVEEPVAGNDGVVVSVHACGICGTDMHVFNSELFIEASTKVIDGHRIIGHEFIGDIVEVGPEVTGWQVGDRVASVHNKGGMAEYVHVPGRWLKDLYRLPPDLPDKAAVTLEPFCNPVHSFHLREPRDGDTVAIFGCGIIGLGYLQMVKAHARVRTVVVDLSPLRLDMARKLGADLVINARETDPVQEIMKFTGEHYVRYLNKPSGRCDIAIECAGQPVTLEQALQVVKPVDGTVIVAAAYEDILPLDPNLLLLKHISLYGSMGYKDEEAAEALRLISSGKVQRDLLVTHTFPLEQAHEAFRVQGNLSVSIKVVVVN